MSAIGMTGGWTAMVGLALVAGTAAAAPAQTGAEVFALIVTNNRSTNLDRPDLQYADDDGVHYYRTFSAVAKPGRVRLLTRFDRATEIAHPELLPGLQPPRRADVLAALGAMQVAVAEVRRSGRQAHFYFVFAGHGDVEEGTGYVDLEDGRIDSSFLEREVVDRMGADVQHILLDSCNSFFVVNPRKPGGRRWATPNDMAMGFASRHPNVGLFLSTNSEAEVYEWSELESGIFSHEVRSGLSGAADANGDGQVSYVELAAFVDRANAKLPRANLRPQVFYRGPSGDGAAALFDLRTAAGRRVSLGPGQRRLWIRGATGERLVDLHKEAGPMELVLPVSSSEPLSILEWLSPGSSAARPVLKEYEVPAGSEPVTLAGLSAVQASSSSRGAAAMFGQLFAEPYGARTLAAYLEEQGNAVAPVFGISSADETRMRHYLSSIAASDRDTYRAWAIGATGTGAMLAVSALSLYFAEPRWGGSRTGTVVMGAGGLALIAGGLYLGLTESLGQTALRTFEAELRGSPVNRALAVAKTESFLDDIAKREQRTKNIFAGIFAAGALAWAGVTTVQLLAGEYSGSEAASAAIGYGNAALMGVFAWHISYTEPPTQRLLRLYREDPDLKLRLGIAPVPGGATLGLGGRF